MMEDAESTANRPLTTKMDQISNSDCPHVKRLLTQLKHESRLLGSSPTFAHALRIDYDRLNTHDITVLPVVSLQGNKNNVGEHDVDPHARTKLLEVRFKYTIIPAICLQQNNQVSITTCLAIIEEVTHWAMLIWRGNTKRNAIKSTVLQAEWGAVKQRPSPGDVVDIRTCLQRNDATKESSSIGFVNAEIRNDKGTLIFYASTVKAAKKQYAIQQNKVLAWNHRYNNVGSSGHSWYSIGRRGNKPVHHKIPQTYELKQLFGYIEYLDRTEKNNLQLSATFPPMIAHGSLDGPIHHGCQAILMELVGKEEAKNVLSSPVELEFIYVTYQSPATACVQIDTEVLSHNEHRLSMRVVIRSVTSPSESLTSIISEGLLHWVPCDYSSTAPPSPFGSSDAFSNAVAPASVIHRAQRKPPTKHHTARHQRDGSEQRNGDILQARRKSEDEPLDPLYLPKTSNTYSAPQRILEEDRAISLAPVAPPQEAEDSGEIKALSLGAVAPASPISGRNNMNGVYPKHYEKHQPGETHKIPARVSPKRDRHHQEEELHRHQSRFSLEKAASRRAFHHDFYSNSEPHQTERSPASLELAVAAVNKSHEARKSTLMHSVHVTERVEESHQRSIRGVQQRSESPIVRKPAQRRPKSPQRSIRGVQRRSKSPIARKPAQQRPESPAMRERNHRIQYQQEVVTKRAPPSQRWEDDNDTNVSPEIGRRKSPPRGPIRFERNIDSPTPSMAIMNEKLNQLQAGTPKELSVAVASRSKSAKIRTKTKVQYVPA